MSKKDFKKIIKSIQKLKPTETIMIEYNDYYYDIICIDECTVLVCDMDIMEYTKDELIKKITDEFKY